MFGILNTAFRIATRSETWPDCERRPVRRGHEPAIPRFDENPVNPRTGLRPGESWTDRA